MGLIRLNKYELPNILTTKGYSSIKVKSNPVIGYVPLLKLIDIYSGSNDYFKIQHGSRHFNSVVRLINFESANQVFSFYQNMRSGIGQFNTMSISMLSILGMQGRVEELISQGKKRVSFKTRKQKIIVTNPVDVFIFAMVKPSDIGKIKVNRNHFEFDSSMITLFVSEEKYANKKFLDNNYNKTVAKYLRQNINTFIKHHDIKVEIVSDNILKQYYTNPFSIENNSVFELMEIDKQIKEKVFSNINDKLLV